MSFCPKCGRQRTGSVRFCGGCGHEFSAAPTDDLTAQVSEPVADAGPAVELPQAETVQASQPEQWDPAAQDASLATAPAPMSWDVPTDAGPWAQPVDATRMDLAPEATRIDLPGPAATRQPPGRQPAPAEPDPFASWFVPGTPAEQPTETVLANRGSSGAGYQPSQQPAAAVPPPPPYQPPPGGRSSGGRRALWIVVPLVVALAAGGAAYALTRNLGKHPSAQSTTTPTVHASTAASTPPASPNGSASATTSASLAVTPTPSPSLVTIASGVGSTAATPQVETLLSHYFHGINTLNYAEYSSTLTAQNKADQTQLHFDSGYATTSDSGMTLTSLTDTGGGDLTATVTFTSHQSPANSIDNSACNDWTSNFYLVPNGTGYLIAPDPVGYTPSYSDC